jgi:hypothetical protein
MDRGASHWLIEVVRSGFMLLWDRDGPALSSHPVQFPLPHLPGAVDALDQEVASLLAKGAVERVARSHSRGFYSRLFVVPKKNGKLRPVLDLSPLNQFLRRIKFKMETPARVRLYLRPGGFATSIDLTDAYFHVGIHSASRHWLRFVWQGRIFQFRVLPFGLSLSPWSLLASRETSARVLYAVLGRMESMALLLPLARLYKRPLQSQLATRWCQSLGEWEDRIALGPWFREAIGQWLSLEWLHSSVPFSLGPPLVEVFTDASLEGWGAHCGELVASGVWAMSEDRHINLLEMEAVRLALLEFAHGLPQGHVQVVSDNTSAVASINNQGGSRSLSLTQSVSRILLWAQDRRILLSARHLAGRLNILADLLSRNSGVCQTEWTLSHRVLAPLWQAWGRPSVDLFATRFNHRLPLFVSPVEDPRAWAVEALSFSWKGLDAYAFPPLALLHRVLRKARLDQPRLIRVAPYWPARPWFPLLLELSRDQPVPLVLGQGDLVQPRSQVGHGNTAMLQLHAWLLCDTFSVPQGSLRERCH